MSTRGNSQKRKNFDLLFNATNVPSWDNLGAGWVVSDAASYQMNRGTCTSAGCSSWIDCTYSRPAYSEWGTVFSSGGVYEASFDDDECLRYLRVLYNVDMYTVNCLHVCATSKYMHGAALVKRADNLSFSLTRRTNRQSFSNFVVPE